MKLWGALLILDVSVSIVVGVFPVSFILTKIIIRDVNTVITAEFSVLLCSYTFALISDVFVWFPTQMKIVKIQSFLVADHYTYNPYMKSKPLQTSFCNNKGFYH